jgi:hypothetical protein
MIDIVAIAATPAAMISTYSSESTLYPILSVSGGWT